MAPRALRFYIKHFLRKIFVYQKFATLNKQADFVVRRDDCHGEAFKIKRDMSDAYLRKVNLLYVLKRSH